MGEEEKRLRDCCKRSSLMRTTSVLTTSCLEPCWTLPVLTSPSPSPVLLALWLLTALVCPVPMAPSMMRPVTPVSVVQLDPTTQRRPRSSATFAQRSMELLAPLRRMEGRKEGGKEGRAQGRTQGRAEGRKEGRKDGR